VKFKTTTDPDYIRRWRQTGRDRTPLPGWPARNASTTAADVSSWRPTGLFSSSGGFQRQGTW